MCWIKEITRAKSSVTSSCLFGYCASKLVCGPKNVKSTNSSQEQACQEKFLGKLLTILQLIRALLAYIDDHPSKVLNLSTNDLSLDCQFTTLFYALLRMWGFSRSGNFSVAVAEVRDWNISLFGLTMSSFGLHSRSIPCTQEPFSAVFQPLSCHPRIPTRTIVVFGEQEDIPSSVLFPIRVPTELPQKVFLTRGQQMDALTKFRSRRTTGTKILATCVVEDVSKSMDIQTGIFSNFGASSIFAWRYADTSSTICPAHPGNLAISNSFATIIFARLTILVLGTPRVHHIHLSPYLLGTRIVILYSWCIDSKSAFSRWQMSINVAKCTCFFSCCCSRITSFLLLTFCQAKTFLEGLPFFFHCNLGIQNFHRWNIGINLCTQLWWVRELNRISVMWTSWFLGRVDTKSFLVDSWTSTIQAYLIFLCGWVSPLAKVSSTSWNSFLSPSCEFFFRFELFLYILRLLHRWGLSLAIFWHCRALPSR